MKILYQTHAGLKLVQPVSYKDLIVTIDDKLSVVHNDMTISV